MKIALGSDHAGYEMKMAIADHLLAQGYEIVDVGHDSATEAGSYVKYGAAAARLVAAEEVDLGIVICGTGIGISLSANKVAGVRCALCTNEFMAGLARRHNDANMLALGARVLAVQHAQAIADRFLAAEFEGGRHALRVNELCQLDD